MSQSTANAAARHAPRTMEARDRLRDDFDTLMRDARELLNATSEDANDATRDARERLAKTLDEARGHYDDAENLVLAKVEQADAYVRKNPYQALGVAAGLGLIAGLFFGRK